MSWVEPFFSCGECGGEIGRWPMVNMLRQEILDWRHRSVPAGTAPHRAVLGTPGPKAREIRSAEKLGLDQDDDEEIQLPDPVPPPEVPARPALAGDLPSSATSLDKLAQAHDWAVEAWFMRGTRMDARWKAGRVVSSVVLRLHRDGHRLVACWQTDSKEAWKFDEAYSLTHYIVSIGSPELRRLVQAPRAICEDCQEPPALHVSTPTGPVCFNERPAEIPLPPGGTA